MHCSARCDPYLASASQKWPLKLFYFLLKVELRIDNNQICGVQGSPFNNMPRLRILSMRDNQMMSFPEKAIERIRGNIALLDIEGTVKALKPGEKNKVGKTEICCRKSAGLFLQHGVAASLAAGKSGFRATVRRWISSERLGNAEGQLPGRRAQY